MDNGVLVVVIGSVVAIIGALIATIFVMKNADEANKASHDRRSQPEESEHQKK